MQFRYLLAVLALSTGALAMSCARSSSPAGPDPNGTPAPSGVAERVEVDVSLAFGDPPVEGVLSLIPDSSGLGVRYRIDFDADGTVNHEGALGLAASYPYRFESPGVHRIRVQLEGASGDREAEAVVIVNRAEALPVLQRTVVPPAIEGQLSFEGIAVERSGQRLYVGGYRSGTLVQLDAGTLEVLSRIDTMGTQMEGLAIAPSDTLLFAVYKAKPHVATVRIPSMELRKVSAGLSGFWIHAVDDRRIVTSGSTGRLHLVDTATGQILGSALRPTGEVLRSWHFDVSPDRSTLAVVGVRGGSVGNTIHMLDVPSLLERREIILPSLVEANLVAFHPRGDRIYVLGVDGVGARFLVVDLTTGKTVRDLPLGRAFCSGYCVANPVARSRSGRWVAMEWSGGAYVIETSLDLPLYRLGDIYYGSGMFGMSVAASPTEEAFFFLRSSGELMKVGLP